MTTQEWFEWKKRLDPNFIIPSKEEQDKYEAEQRLLWEAEKKNRKQDEPPVINMDVPCC